jgi:hypothetical protein
MFCSHVCDIKQEGVSETFEGVGGGTTTFARLV